MSLVLKCRVAILRKKARIVRNHIAQRLNPGPIRLGKVAQHIAVHEFLHPRMTDPKTHAAIVVADVRGDRAQPVVPGDPAADFHAHFRRRQLKLVMEHCDLTDGELEEICSLTDGASGLVHVGHWLKQDYPLAVEQALTALALKAAAPR